MPFAAALSEHPLATQAVGEVVGAVLDQLGTGPERPSERGKGPVPDLAVLFVGVAHTGAVDDIAAAVRELLAPGVLLGCTTGTVAGVEREVEDSPAVSLFAGNFDSVVPFRLRHARMEEGSAVVGFPAAEDLPAEAGAVLLLADPFSFPAEQFVAGLVDQAGIALPVVGGLASAARGPGGNRLILDAEVQTDGAVGVVIGGADLDVIVSQGCRPVGEPMVVTGGERQLITSLASRPALERVQELLHGLGPDDLALARRGLHVGRVIDERRIDHGRGDFLIRSVLGADRERGALAVGDQVDVGATVQFQVRDAASADEDLRHLLDARTADGALLFTCNGRGTQLFGDADHDAVVLAEVVGVAPMAGMSCAGELGPVGNRSFVHGFTACVVLFRD